MTAHFLTTATAFVQIGVPHDAVRKAKGYLKEGSRWVIDMDLEKFFDRVNHDRLMATLAKRISDKPLLKLIRKYLQAGVMINNRSPGAQTILIIFYNSRIDERLCKPKYNEWPAS